MTTRTYLSFLCPVDREDDVAGRLALAGSLGWQTRDEAGALRIEADFDDDELDGAEQLLAELVDEFPTGDARLDRRVPQPDWIAESLRGLEPFPVGQRLWVDPTPGGSSIAAPADRVVLRIAPERAFGTGTHESTRLLLEALDADPPVGGRVLDVGTGSAILALAAAGLGARHVVAFDNDHEAVFCARRNAPGFPAASPVALFAGTLDAVAPARFDVVLANIVPEVQIPLMPELARRVAPGGRLLLAGILAEAGDSVANAAVAAGLREKTRPARGEWVAIDARWP